MKDHLFRRFEEERSSLSKKTLSMDDYRDLLKELLRQGKRDHLLEIIHLWLRKYFSLMDVGPYDDLRRWSELIIESFVVHFHKMGWGGPCLRALVAVIFLRWAPPLGFEDMPYRTFDDFYTKNNIPIDSKIVFSLLYEDTMVSHECFHSDLAALFSTGAVLADKNGMLYPGASFPSLPSEDFLKDPINRWGFWQPQCLEGSAKAYESLGEGFMSDLF